MGFHISFPALPGHMTRPRDLAPCRWPDWLGEAERALRELETETGPVAIVSHSMGGLLALHLAALHPHRVARVLVAAPAFHIRSAAVRWAWLLRWFVPYLPSRTSYVDPAMANFQPNYHWVPPGALRSVAEYGRIVWLTLPLVRAPVWALLGLADRVVDGARIEQAVTRLGSVEREVRRYPNSAHQLFLDAARDRVLGDVRAFLTGRKSPIGVDTDSRATP